MIKIKKIKKYLYDKNQIISYFLFLFLFFFDLSFIILNTNTSFKYIFFLLWNCIIIIFFCILNKIYKNENKKREIEINKLLKINTIINDNQNNIYKLFKRTCIQKNIIQNDYNKIEKNFKKFIPEEFIKNISKWIKEDINIGLSLEKKIHIMFIDISGFTEISESLSSEKSLLLLNIYFDWIVEISKNNWWYVDKFLWDWIMLVFDNKESDYILKTAIEIKDLVDKINIANFKHKINIWIWINSWKATLWTIWSKNRMDITIIWDNVNIASRIQNFTRYEKEWILFSKKTFDLIKNKKHFNIKKIWEKELKWKKEKIELFWIKEKS